MNPSLVLSHHVLSVSAVLVYVTHLINNYIIWLSLM